MTKATERKSKLKKKSSNRKSSSSKSVLEAVSSETSAAMTTATKGNEKINEVNTQDVSPETKTNNNTSITPANNNNNNVTIDLCDSPSPQKADNAKISKKQKLDVTSTTITPAAKVDDIMDGNEKEVMVKSATLPPQDVAASTSFKENEVKESSTSTKKKKKKKPKKSNDTSSAAAATATATTDTKQSATAKVAEPQKKKRKKKRSFHDQILYTMLTSCKPYTLKSLAKATDTTVETLRHAMLSFVDKKLVLTKEFPSKKDSSREPKKLYWANPMTIDEISASSMANKGKGGGVANQFSKLLSTTDEIEESNKTRQQLDQQQRAIQAELKPLLAIPTMKQLEDENKVEEEKLVLLQKEIEAVKDRIANPSKVTAAAKVPSRMSSGHSSASYYPANRFQQPKPKPQDKTTLKRKINHMLGEYKARKRKCMDFVDMIADAMEKRPKDVMGEKVLDLETDEQEWGMYQVLTEDGTTGKIYGTKPKSNAKRGLLGKKNDNNDVDEVPIVKIPAKYKDF